MTLEPERRPSDMQLGARSPSRDQVETFFESSVTKAVTPAGLPPKALMRKVWITRFHGGAPGSWHRPSGRLSFGAVLTGGLALALSPGL